MSKFLKVLFAIAAFVAVIPLLDRAVKFLMDNTHTYTKHDEFEL